MEHLVVRTSLDRPSSRGLLEYTDSTFGPKTFTYTTPPLRANPEHLVGTQLLHARAFHFFGTPDEIISQVPTLLRLRNQHSAGLPRPFIVWEPLPASCIPQHRAAFQAACALVDIFSPNHLELASLFSDHHPHSTAGDLNDPFSSLPLLTSLATTLIPKPRGTLVLRAAAAGALALTHDSPPVRVPAFFDADAPEVVDPTGAGNAFLGGYVAGWLRSEGEVLDALCCGAVAAGFALKQIGLPEWEVVGDRRGVEECVTKFRERVRAAVEDAEMRAGEGGM